MIAQEAVVLSSKKVYLRKFRHSEADLLHSIASDPDVIMFCGGSHSIQENKNNLHRIMSSYKANTGLWAFVHRPTMEFAGYAGLVYENSNIPEFKVAILEKFRRNGLASEALKMCVDHAEKNLPPGTVEAYVSSENKPAKNFIRKAGFKFTKNIFFKGKAHEIYTYALVTV